MKKTATKGIRVADYMKPATVCFDLRDDVADIAAVLLENKLSGAPVVDGHSRLVGFVSEQDCIKQMLNTAWHCEQTATALDLMQSKVLTVDPELGITDLAELLAPDKPKLYPVVSAGKLVGVISRSDVLDALVEMSAHCHHVGTQSAEFA